MKSYKDTENKILGNLLREPLKSKSLHQISLDTKLSYVTVHKITPILVKRKLVKQEKKGKAKTLAGNFIPTKKNSVAKDFYKNNGFKLAKKDKEIPISFSGTCCDQQILY